jgi:PAS domain-containing protein
MANRLRVITFPHDDGAFRVHIEAAQAALGKWDPDRIADAVRRAYPTVSIRSAHGLARLTPDEQVFYAYRDGRADAAWADGEWWLDPDLPRTWMTQAGDYVDANEAAADLFGVVIDGIRNRPAGSFTRHEHDPEIGARLFALLVETGVLHSTAVVVRPDGEEWPIEFHTSQSADTDLFSTVMRRI